MREVKVALWVVVLWLAWCSPADLGLLSRAAGQTVSAASLVTNQPANFPLNTIVSSNSGSTVFAGVDINYLIGATQFYWNGYWGGGAVVANVEAGYVWNGHETLGQVQTYVSLNNTGQFDWHATMVGQVINGQGSWPYGWYLGTASNPYLFNTSAYYGIAPGATLWSAAIATQWDPEPSGDYTGTFEISAQSMVYGYKTVMGGINGVKANVVNSSWGEGDPSGSQFETMVIDALAYANGTTVTLAAGNHDSGTAQVVGPGSGFNCITVGALTSDTTNPVYSQLASWSNTGPNDFYNPQTGQYYTNVRAAVDIVAPGDDLTLAYYGGLTGGHTSGTDPVNGSGQYYVANMAGTSFATPIVAGSAALLVDAGKVKFGGGYSIDGRVIKAVLMNSADKFVGWDNGQTLVNGVVTTTQALDYSFGAGMLDLNRAYTQYLGGTADVPGLGGGTISRVGWDYGQVSAGQPNIYYFSQAFSHGCPLTVTLDWFVNRQLDDSDPNNPTVSDVQFDNLDLEVLERVNGQWQLVGQSISQFDNTQHLYFDLPGDGYYALEVLWAGTAYSLLDTPTTSDVYGLAWSVTPEPSCLALLAVGSAGFVLSRFRRKML